MSTISWKDYSKATQRFLREQRQEFSNPADLLEYINLARREVAGRTQSVRRLTPISGQVVAAVVKNGGSGYTNPQAVITTPDWPSGAPPNPNGRQAAANVTQAGGVITGVDIIDGGDGYFQPQITFTDGAGTGAVATLTVSPINLLNGGQEVYNFSDINTDIWAGVDVVHAIKSVSIVYAQYRYSVPIYSFSTYQAMIRNYSTATYQYIPSFGAQYGQGAGGSFYLYPPPNATYQLEFDCFCLPEDMRLDNSISEVIPQPWTDAVKYMAAQLAFMELGNYNAARFYEDQFDKRTLGYSTQARPGRATNMYGRY
jgi:hypothetical protein